MSARQNRHSRHRAQQLAERAGSMRWAPTQSEAMLWEELRGRKLGVTFRRQVVVGEYVVDFLAAEVRLVVEVDGGWHRGRERADARRVRKLEAEGFRVLRFSVEAVVGELPRVVAAIREAVVEGGRAE